MLGLWQHTLLGRSNVVGLCWAWGNTLYLVMLLVYVGPWATVHWVMLLGLGQHTLLGNVVGLCWALGNALHWVMMLVYVGPWTTHFTG
jgi:hypothetical protein